MKPCLHVVPAPLAGKKEELSALTIEVLASADVLIAEKEKQGARLLALASNRKAEVVSLSLQRRWQELMDRGGTVVLTSDAGYPAVMDPGREVVFYAHSRGYPVKVYPGPSSIIMALAGSGLPSVPLFFWGYVPRGRVAREHRIKELERVSRRSCATQIIVETAYRTHLLLESCLSVLRGDCWLSVAQQLGDPTRQRIVTAQIKDWINRNLKEQIHPREPTVFLLFAGRL